MLIHHTINGLTARWQKIYVRFPYFAQKLGQAVQNTVSTSDGMLLFKVSNFSRYNYRVWSSAVILDHFSKTDLFIVMQKEPGHMPCQSLLRPFFRELYIRKREKSNVQKNESSTSPYLAYVIDDTYQRLFYQEAGDCNYSLIRQVVKPTDYDGKKFYIKSHSAESHDAAFFSLISFLTTLTGGSVENLQIFCKLFYRIMTNTPNKSCATIVYSSLNAHMLCTFFNSIFESDIPSFSYPPEKTSITLNTLTQKKYLMALAEQNIFGCPFLFIDDVSPSTTSYKSSYELSHGKSVDLPDAYVVGQRFKNQVHLLCLTNNMARAKNLSDKLNVSLMNFSAEEQLLSSNMSFSENEKHWLLLALPLYGMLLESYVKLPKVKQSKKEGPIDDSLKSFLMSCCCTGSLISTADLYDAYCEYYSSLHRYACPHSRTMFTRRVEASREYLPAFERKKKWVTSSSQLWHFVGISLKENWRNLIPSPLDLRSSDGFIEQLWLIHENSKGLAASPPVSELESI